MRRFFTLASAVTAAALWVVGCSSDSTSGTSNTGGTGGTGGSSNGGSGGSASSAKCTAPQYADVAVSDFVSGADASKACAAATDATNVCTNDISKIAATCGKSCLVAGDDAAQAMCVGTCINQGLPSSATPFSDACLSCYEADVQCAKMKCFAMCAGSPTSPACAQCRIDMGCAAAYYDCSGLLMPTGLDLGAGGASTG